MERLASKKHCSCPLISVVRACPVRNIRLGRKWQAGRDALPYTVNVVFIIVVKSFTGQARQTISAKAI
jgi:hypothetical protein